MKKKIIYVPYGEQWEKELMKTTKKYLIQMLRRVCQKRDEFEKLYYELLNKEKEG